MKPYTQPEISVILEKHSLWLCGAEGGERANLEGANLKGANLEEANLKGANLEGANLEWANLEEANLKGANLEGANLKWANLKEANLKEANLKEANLKGANLKEANLKGANLWNAHGKNSRISTFHHERYSITILDSHFMQNATVWGGCTYKSAGDWLEYDGEGLGEYDKNYLNTYTKPLIKMICGI